MDEGLRGQADMDLPVASRTVIALRLSLRPENLDRLIVADKAVIGIQGVMLSKRGQRPRANLAK